MTTIVVDASTALAWLLPSQATKSSNRLLQQADGFDFIVPHIFTWEVANVLVVRARRQGSVPAEALGQLDTLEIDLDPALDSHEIRQLMEVSLLAGISLFDAAYLGLAVEREAWLASRDVPLLSAAIAAGVDVLDLRD